MSERKYYDMLDRINFEGRKDINGQGFVALSIPFKKAGDAVTFILTDFPELTPADRAIDQNKSRCRELANVMRPESPFIIGMFHDLCKVDQCREVVDEPGKVMFGEFEPKGREVHYEWADPFVKGHGDKSVMYLSHLMRLTEEEMFCIRYHMGAFEKDDIEGYSKAVEKFNNVLFAHTADMMASKIQGV